MKVQAQVTDMHGETIADHEIRIPAYETKELRLNELEPLPKSAAGGIRITYQTQRSRLLVEGGLEDPATGYSANLVVSSSPHPESSSSRRFVALGLMSGVADPMMHFPSGTKFSPYVVLRNISASEIQVTPTINWMQASNAHSVGLGPIKLQPLEARVLEMTQLLNVAELGTFAGNINVVMDLLGPPHSLLVASGSVDQRNTYVFAVRPSGVRESVAKTLSYWSTGNGEDTMVTLWNPAEEAQDLFFHLYFATGEYALPVHLEGLHTHSFNISELSQIPDSQGRTIPPNIHEGSAEIAGSKGTNQHILVAMDAGTYNVSKATCNLYCVTCEGAVRGVISANPFDVSTGGSTQLSLIAQYHDGDQYDDTAEATWSSSNTSIATVSAGLVNGVSAGSVTINASDDSEDDYTAKTCDADGPPDCPITTGIDGGGQGTVANPPPGCPTDINLTQSTSISLQNNSSNPNMKFPTLRTGVGIVAQMTVSDPTGKNWNNALITEVLTAGANSCNASVFPPACGHAINFTVGSGGGTTFGVPIPATTNAFWDQHAALSTGDLLTIAGQSSCTQVCYQSYTCRGTPINNNFTITKTYTKGTINGVSVTNVSVTKELQ